MKFASVIWGLAGAGLAAEDKSDVADVKDCRCWASQGQCEANSAWMWSSCAASCARHLACEEYLSGRGEVATRLAELEQRAKDSEAALARAQVKISELEAEKLKEQQSANECRSQAKDSEVALAHAQAKISELEGEKLKEQLSANESRAHLVKLEMRVVELDEQLSQAQANASVVPEVAVATDSTAPALPVVAPTEEAGSREGCPAADASCESTTAERELGLRITRLEEKVAQESAENIAAHSQLHKQVEMCTRNLSAQMRALEELSAKLLNGHRHESLAPAYTEAAAKQQLHVEMQQLEHQDAVPPLIAEPSRQGHLAETPLSEEGRQLSWLDAASSKLGNASAQVSSFYQERLQPLMQQSWAACSTATLSAQEQLAAAWRYAQPLAATAFGDVLNKAAGYAQQASSSVGQNESSNATQPDASTEGENQGSTIPPALLAGSVVVVVLLLLLRFCRRLRELLLWPLRSVLHLFRRLVLIAVWPITFVFGRICCCCAAKRKKAEEGETQPVVANMGLQNAMYYDKDKGKWREKGKEHLEEEDKPLAPPPMMGGHMIGSPMIGSAANSRVNSKEPSQEPKSSLDSMMAPPSNPFAQGRMASRPRPPAPKPPSASPFASPRLPPAQPTAENEPPDLGGLFC